MKKRALAVCVFFAAWVLGVAAVYLHEMSQSGDPGAFAMKWVAFTVLAVITCVGGVIHPALGASIGGASGVVWSLAAGLNPVYLSALFLTGAVVGAGTNLLSRWRIRTCGPAGG